MAAPAWHARMGLISALGVVLAVLAAIRLGLEDPWWAAISAWIVSNPDRHALLDKALQRAAGTLAGVSAGYVAAGAAAGLPVMQAILLFAVGALGTWKRFAAPRWNYAWFYAAVTAAVVLVQSLAASGDLYAFAHWRAYEILCGVAAATLVDAILGGGGPQGATSPPAPAVAAAGPGPEIARVALVGGSLLVLVPLLWSLFDLPAVTQIAVSALVVLDRDAGGMGLRGSQRLLGCLAGGAYGLAALGGGLDVFPVWLAALGGGGLLFSTLHHGGGPKAYVGTQGGVAVIMTLVTGSGPPDSLLPVLDRLAGITLGVGLLVLLSRMFTPRPPVGAAAG
jgi:uncharacterized membrane protein YccC